MVKNGNFEKMLTNKAFMLLLTSQGLSSFGDAFHVIALTTLLFKMTGSGLAAGFAIICTPLTSLFLSPVAGILGDKFNSKRILVLIDIIRGAIAFLFTLNYKIHAIYIFTLMLSSFEVLYNPVRNKVLTSILNNKYLVSASSLQSGVFGITYIFGLLSAGIIVDLWGAETAFIVNSYSFFSSALLIILINNKYLLYKSSDQNMPDKINRSFFKHSKITQLLEIGFIIGFCTASINITFYTFAFDKLGITNRGWSLLLSTLYGTNLIAMLLSIVFIRKIEKPRFTNIYILMIVVSVVWFFYSTLENLRAVILLQIIEGISLSLIAIMLGSYLLIEARNKFTARVIASSDFFSNIGKLTSISLTYIFLRLFEYKYFFAANSAIFFIFPVYKLLFRKLK